MDNHNGTAPGLILEENGKIAILLPGPPNEIKPMFEQDIAPYLNKLQPEGIYSKMAKICSIGESKAETMISDLMDAQTNPTIAPYAKTGEVHLRVTAKADSEEKAQELMAPMMEELFQRFGDKIYTTEEDVTLEEAICTDVRSRWHDGDDGGVLHRRTSGRQDHECAGGLQCL